MVVSIPPKDINLEDYIASGEAWLNMDAYVSGEATEQCRECKVHMPKFNLSTDEVDLADTLRGIGISRIFEPDADFSPLSDDPLMVDDIFQSTRLSIDEEGLEGASYVAIVFCGCALQKILLSRARSLLTDRLRYRSSPDRKSLCSLEP